jgi:hypothetical protein
VRSWGLGCILAMEAGVSIRRGESFGGTHFPGPAGLDLHAVRS